MVLLISICVQRVAHVFAGVNFNIFNCLNKVLALSVISNSLTFTDNMIFSYYSSVVHIFNIFLTEFDFRFMTPN